MTNRAGQGPQSWKDLTGLPMSPHKTIPNLEDFRFKKCQGWEDDFLPRLLKAGLLAPKQLLRCQSRKLPISSMGFEYYHGWITKHGLIVTHDNHRKNRGYALFCSSTKWSKTSYALSDAKNKNNGTFSFKSQRPGSEEVFAQFVDTTDRSSPALWFSFKHLIGVLDNQEELQMFQAKYDPSSFCDDTPRTLLKQLKNETVFTYTKKAVAPTRARATAPTPVATPRTPAVGVALTPAPTPARAPAVAVARVPVPIPVPVPVPTPTPTPVRAPARVVPPARPFPRVAPSPAPPARASTLVAPATIDLIELSEDEYGSQNSVGLNVINMNDEEEEVEEEEEQEEEDGDDDGGDGDDDDDDQSHLHTRDMNKKRARNPPEQQEEDEYQKPAKKLNTKEMEARVRGLIEDCAKMQEGLKKVLQVFLEQTP